MSDYWIGPYGVKVASDINQVFDKDGRNLIFKDGGTTEMVYGSELNEEEYKNKYTKLGEDGNHYYIKQIDWNSWEDVKEIYTVTLTPSNSPEKVKKKSNGGHGIGNWA